MYTTLREQMSSLRIDTFCFSSLDGGEEGVSTLGLGQDFLTLAI